MASRNPRQGKNQGDEKQSSSGQAGGPKHVSAQLVLEKSARILTKTYAYAGDEGEKIAAEDALRLLVREFRQYDQQLLLRNEKRAVR